MKEFELITRLYLNKDKSNWFAYLKFNTSGKKNL